MLQFICYPRCTTCKKAQAWLDENNIEYTLRDIKADNPTLDELKAWCEAGSFSPKKFFNTSGILYRSMDLKNKLGDMRDEEQLLLLASDGMLVKRPIALTDGAVLVGFNTDKWASVLL